MTPNNIVNMALLKGLDAIAITDHNSAKNVRACVECGNKNGLVVIPGMEIETSEDVHLICLFDTVEKAEKMDMIVSNYLPLIKNREDIFGAQYVIDELDNVKFTVENLLSTATTIDVYSAVEIVRELGGVIIPAHVDKSSYSIISNLGFIPEDISFSTVEVRFKERLSELKKSHNLDKYKIIHNSDAHFLWDIQERERFIDILEINPLVIINYLKG
jgi:PHP family Zn ribbon phosphoesterase